MRSATGKSMPSKAITTCCALKSPLQSGNPTGSCTGAQLIRVMIIIMHATRSSKTLLKAS